LYSKSRKGKGADIKSAPFPFLWLATNLDGRGFDSRDRTSATQDLSVLGQFSYANLELVKAEGFTRELRLDPRRLDDAAIESIRQRVWKAGI
jgi:hypothetical protein